MRRVSSMFAGVSGRLLVLMATALVIVAGLIVRFGPTSEPRFRGETLGFWLEDWYSQPGSPGSIPLQQWAAKRQGAELAIRELGTNTIPTLTRMLRRRDSPLKVRLMRNRGVQWLAAKGLLPAIWIEPAWRSNRTAAQALGVLGAAAAPAAVPDLIEALERNPDQESRRCAAACLGAIGPDAAKAVPALTRASIVESDNYLRTTAREALHSMGSSRTNGLQVALEYELSDNDRIQAAAAVTLVVVDPGRIYGRGSNADPVGPANGTHPIRSETHRTSLPVGSGR